MKRIYLIHFFSITLLVFVVQIWPVTGQNQRVDSLRQLILSLPDEAEKADMLILLAKDFFSSDKESAWYYNEKAFAIASQKNYLAVQAESCYLKSLLLQSKDEIREALAAGEKFLVLADSTGDSSKIAKANYHRGNLHSNTLENIEAIDCYRKSLAIYIKLNDTRGIVANYHSLGAAFSRQATYDSSIVYYLKAIGTYEKSGEERHLGSFFYDLSEVYLQQEELEKARQYAVKSKEVYAKYGNTAGLALVYTILGRISSEQDDFRDALNNYHEAELLYLQKGDSIGLADIQNNMGVIHHDQENYAMAKQCYNKALKIYRKKQKTRGIIVSLGNMASVFCDQGNYSEAIALHDSVLVLSTRYAMNEYRKDALWNISDSYRKSGDYRKAYEYLIRFTVLKDSLYSIEKTELISDLTFRYEKEKDQANILALEKDNLQKDLVLRKRTSQRNAYLFTGIAIIALAVFLLLYFRQKALKDKIIADQKIRQLEEEKKLMAAKSLVEGQEEERKRIATELHDGLGVILSATKMQFSAIKDTSPANLPIIARATQLLEQASSDVRKISHNMMPGLLTKLGLYEAVGDLFESIGDTGKLKAECIIQEDMQRLPVNQEIMLYRIIQELVNNTMKHARAENIRLEIRALPGKLFLQYSDDGVGFEVDKMMESKSLGLKSIQSRVDFLSGSVSIESKPSEGAAYFIQIPAFIV